MSGKAFPTNQFQITQNVLIIKNLRMKRCISMQATFQYAAPKGTAAKQIYSRVVGKLNLIS